jgi:hypothetical protein
MGSTGELPLVMVDHRAYGIWDWPDDGGRDLECGINDAARRDGDCPERARYALLVVRDGEPSLMGPLRGPYCREHASKIVTKHQQLLSEIEVTRARAYRKTPR